jgi:hypothetical protein
LFTRVDSKSVSVSVTFYRGKAAQVRGPYTVHTGALPLHWLQHIVEAMKLSPTRLFQGITTTDMLHVFRAVRKDMEAKSLRRGSLQELALSGTPIPTLMHFSGHTSERTLLRYLCWGQRAGAIARAMITAGACLIPPTNKAEITESSPPQHEPQHGLLLPLDHDKIGAMLRSM